LLTVVCLICVVLPAPAALPLSRDVYVYVWLDGCGGLYVFVITSVLCKYFQLFASFLLLFPHTHMPEHQDTTHVGLSSSLMTLSARGAAGGGADAIDT